VVVKRTPPAEKYEIKGGSGLMEIQVKKIRPGRKMEETLKGHVQRPTLRCKKAVPKERQFAGGGRKNAKKTRGKLGIGVHE